MQKYLLTIGSVLVLLTLQAASAVDEKEDKGFTLPRAMLLMGDPPHNLVVTTENKTWILERDTNISGWVSPSISSDGTIVASARLIPGAPFTRAPKLLVSTYSTKEERWTDHRDLVVATGSVAISPDGSQIACQTEPSKEVTPETPPGLRILNIKTGKVTIPHIGTGKSTRSVFSWSPDGGRILLSGNLESSAGEKTGGPVVPTIYVLDVATGSVSKIASGITASWAPSGKRIAVVAWAGPAYNNYRLTIIRPDGTEGRDVMEFRSEVNPILKPVWSPDSQTLLMNVSRNPDEGTWDIYLVDLETMKYSKKFKNVRATVFGWVAMN